MSQWLYNKDPMRLLCLLCMIFLLVLVPLEAQCKKKVRGSKGKKEITMLSDLEIKDAVKNDATIALVKIEGIDVEAPGTRGHQTFYKLQIIQNLLGDLSGVVDARRYGAPVLQQGQQAIVVLQASSTGELPLQACVIVPEEKKSEVVNSHLEKIEKIKSTK